MIKTTEVMTFAVLVSIGSILAAQKTDTWTGRISDSSCGASHDAMTEHWQERHGQGLHAHVRQERRQLRVRERQ